MNLPPEDQYPSTSDFGGIPRIAGAQIDDVLDVLVGGRERVAANHSTNTYIGGSEEDEWVELANGTLVPPVCAIGSVALADGLSEDDLNCWNMDHGDDSTWHAMEDLLSNAARKAIDLLNAEALRRHPDAERYGTWSGPFEYVNQESYWALTRILGRGEDPYTYDEHDRSSIQREVRAEIIDIYDTVIADRSGGPVIA